MFEGITKRINRSQSGAIRLYEEMSRSGYSVDNMSSVQQEFMRFSSRMNRSEDSTATGLSSCYYVPTQITLTYQGNGRFIQQRGGISLVPRLEYQKEPIIAYNPSTSTSGN